MPSAQDLELLDGLSRDELIARARALGATRPELMTRVELRDEIVRLSESDPTARRRSRGWLGVARDLVASVVDSGLKLPGAAAAIRGGARQEPEWHGPPPVATLTLAEIYAAQGHTERALGVLNEILRAEPDHAEALALRERFTRAKESGSLQRPIDVEVVPVTTPETTPNAPALETTEPAPEHPPSDPVCAVAVTSGAVMASYELPSPIEAPTLRIACFTPRRSGPERAETDVPVDGALSAGELVLPAPSEGAVVRVALGAGSGEAFRAVAVAWVYDARGPVFALSFAPPGAEPTRLKARLETTLAATPGR